MGNMEVANGKAFSAHTPSQTSLGKRSKRRRIGTRLYFQHLQYVLRELESTCDGSSRI